MRSKLARIVGIVALGLTVVAGVTADLGTAPVNVRHIQADGKGPAGPVPAPGN
ncbi:hypothetical protein ACIRP0_24720 [Streptomyces sp. NPDC101733]|uniref:hypothetical protein n=1 Tax=unclassified Streptomyces TaxID=2593676 RepID=UPI00380B4281